MSEGFWQCGKIRWESPSPCLPFLCPLPHRQFRVFDGVLRPLRAGVLGEPLLLFHLKKVANFRHLLRHENLGFITADQCTGCRGPRHGLSCGADSRVFVSSSSADSGENSLDCDRLRKAVRIWVLRLNFPTSMSSFSKRSSLLVSLTFF